MLSQGRKRETRVREVVADRPFNSQDLWYMESITSFVEFPLPEFTSDESLDTYFLFVQIGPAKGEKTCSSVRTRTKNILICL